MPTVSGSLASLLEESEALAEASGNILDDSDIGDSDSGETVDEETALSASEKVAPSIRLRTKSAYRIAYEDPWKIHAASVLGEKLGKAQDLIVWSGDGIRLQDPLPPRLLGPKWEGSMSNRIRFNMISVDEVKLHVIYEHTHWGKALKRMCNVPSLHRGWAQSLRYRINRFLAGKSDPLLSKGEIRKIFSDPEYLGPRKERATRLIEVLKTVDGIFLQRYLCYPEEVWTWSRYDQFTLLNLSALIGDEFLDGELTEVGLSITTAYAQLKRMRKWYKLHAHCGDLTEALEGKDDFPRWCRHFIPVWRRAEMAQGERHTYLVGILSQTRGCGTPPPLVALQSKVKFLRTISLEVPPVSATMRRLRTAALSEVLDTLPDSAFTGLATKSRVTVTTSASWEKSRRLGGTAEEIRFIINSAEAGEQVPVRDLSTGQVTGWTDRSVCPSLGEYIFWSCLDHTLRTPLDKLRYAFLTVVKEPGKARTVTKARACLKVVLDLVNKICSEPLKKVESSTSGMGQANHGWNLFLSMMSKEERAELFTVENREESAYEGYVERTDTFEDLYMSSTDYEEATDQMPLDMARSLGEMWMRKCGIPDFLRGIVVATCYMPRTVFFYASGVLETVGTEAPEMGVGIRSVTLRQGILMGDPLTKVVLHLTNIGVRHLGTRLHEPDFYKAFQNGASALEAFGRGMGRDLTPRSSAQ